MKWKVTLSIGYVYTEEEEFDLDELGFSEEEWLELSPEEREKIVDDYAHDWASNYIDLTVSEI